MSRSTIWCAERMVLQDNNRYRYEHLKDFENVLDTVLWCGVIRDAALDDDECPRVSDFDSHTDEAKVCFTSRAEEKPFYWDSKEKHKTKFDNNPVKFCQIRRITGFGDGSTTEFYDRNSEMAETIEKLRENVDTAHEKVYIGYGVFDSMAKSWIHLAERLHKFIQARVLENEIPEEIKDFYMEERNAVVAKDSKKGMFGGLMGEEFNLCAIHAIMKKYFNPSEWSSEHGWPKENYDKAIEVFEKTFDAKATRDPENDPNSKTAKSGMTYLLIGIGDTPYEAESFFGEYGRGKDFDVDMFVSDHIYASVFQERHKKPIYDVSDVRYLDYPTLCKIRDKWEKEVNEYKAKLGLDGKPIRGLALKGKIDGKKVEFNLDVDDNQIVDDEEYPYVKEGYDEVLGNYEEVCHFIFLIERWFDDKNWDYSEFRLLWLVE